MKLKKFLFCKHMIPLSSLIKTFSLYFLTFFILFTTFYLLFYKSYQSLISSFIVLWYLFVFNLLF